MASSDSKLKAASLSNWRQEAQTCLDEDTPACEDFRKAVNLYDARFGEENWMSAMKAACHMSPFVCITDMIEHIVTESAKGFEGNEHEDDWVFYHDALSLMTAAATIAFMNKKDYLKRRVLPVNGLTKEKDLVKFAGRPVGNSPAFMPWECSLNNDIKLSCDSHIIFTNNLPYTYPKKFSMSTPKRGA